ncbi:trypsin-like peptidase domain-containing protein [Streptomyces sp. AV19]|uniref:trypsin-like peptidase domain-containing protein n=1 Tax=Streptomyces sp. AV19 TaxID=2793068 RepID=UPI0018FEFF03|nr:trypsin-like peptidase domain-containing protein [Streptomyces sp. AV19]MBH1938390.1 trypsin-like peptidase domain-containing protein [Streptomyces sp. AV19]MDG4535039.1 trypsin-like peptidase domain-containing protein [Streptomyces sp. AV19]
MTSSRHSRTLSIALAMAACGTTATATTAVAAPGPTPSAPVPTSSASASPDLSYWTAERMAGARPVDAGSAAKQRSGVARSPRAAAAAPKNVKKGSLGDGIPVVGTFFLKGPSGATYCSGGVVQSAGRNLVLTAAHCARPMKTDGSAIFVPQFRKGKDAAHQPFGAFQVRKTFVDERYRSNSKAADSDLDFAFVRVDPADKGKKLQDRVGGGLRLTGTPRWANTVTVYGYPKSANPDQKAVSCTVPTVRGPYFRQLKMECAGYYPGVSGGPWITNYDAKKKTGDVIGNVGGYNGGGDDGNSDWVSYSPVYGPEIQRLYADAVADRKPVPGDLQGPVKAGLPYRVANWKDARHLVTGDFTGDGRDDLLVVWRDGEISSYAGDGKGHFGREVTVRGQNPYWAKVGAVAAGEFNGGGTADLVVRWDNGKVSVFSDVRAGSTGKETTLVKANNTWKHATHFTAGAYNSPGKANDLVVRFDDGEVDLYSGTTASRLGGEKKLVPGGKGSKWAGGSVLALATAQVSGKGNADLLVRRDNGRLETYAGVTKAGLPAAAYTLQGANASYRGAALMAAGDFGGPAGRRDDLVVRWSDGETAYYDRTAANRLGAWTPLVSP